MPSRDHARQGQKPSGEQSHKLAGELKKTEPCSEFSLHAFNEIPDPSYEFIFATLNENHTCVLMGKPQKCCCLNLGSMEQMYKTLNHF